MKIHDIVLSENSRRVVIPPRIAVLIPQVLAAAQRVYDEWDESEEYAGGGICHLIADEICSVFYANDMVANTQSAEQGEQHVWCNVLYREEDADGDDLIAVYEVDIPPGVYERGGGYTWTKLQGVKFEKDDLVIAPVCQGRRCIEDYELSEDY